MSSTPGHSGRCARSVGRATQVLGAAGVPVPRRDAFAEQAFPADRYDLGPAATFDDIDPSLHDLGLAWGAAKGAGGAAPVLPPEGEVRSAGRPAELALRQASGSWVNASIPPSRRLATRSAMVTCSRTLRICTRQRDPHVLLIACSSSGSCSSSTRIPRMSARGPSSPRITSATVTSAASPARLHPPLGPRWLVTRPARRRSERRSSSVVLDAEAIRQVGPPPSWHPLGPPTRRARSIRTCKPVSTRGLILKVTAPQGRPDRSSPRRARSGATPLSVIERDEEEAVVGAGERGGVVRRHPAALHHFAGRRRARRVVATVLTHAHRPKSVRPTTSHAHGAAVHSDETCPEPAGNCYLDTIHTIPAGLRSRQLTPDDDLTERP